MTRTILLALSLLAAPMAAYAMPVVGDVVGVNADDAKAALEKSGCTVDSFESENGTVEAICIETATSKKWDVSIDPATGAIAALKESDE